MALGATQVAVARPGDRTDAWEIDHLPAPAPRRGAGDPRALGDDAHPRGGPDEPPLAVVRYTNRQRRAFENLRFVLEEGLAERRCVPADADREYAEAVAHPVRDAQALVGGRPTAVIWRLLGYLRPYRRELTLGMARGDPDHPGEPGAAVARGLCARPPGGAGARRHAAGRAGGALLAWLAVSAMAVVYLVRQAAAVVRLRLMAIMGEWVARDLRTELYEHLQSLSLVVLRAQEDREHHHPGVRRYRPALGLPRLRRGGCVPLGGHAAGLGVVLVGLDWRLGLAMVTAGAGVLLADLPARRVDQPAVPPGLAEMVAGDATCCRTPFRASGW